MNKYHKIVTVYKRDPATKYKTLLEEFALLEFAYLANNEWRFTEKVDGTNIRVDWNGASVEFGGRTDNAQIPTPLIQHLMKQFTLEKMTSLPPMTLYGEGYGAKIQKGGGNYKSDGVSFVLFDVFCSVWLENHNIADIANKLEIKAVPVVEVGTLFDMIDMVRDGFQSHWGDFIAEGIVARPLTELANRKGERVITKLKYKDFSR